MSYLAGVILRLMGWRVTHPMPEGIKKAIIIMAPHTSNWDFVIGRIGFLYKKVQVKVMIKKESFTFPLGILLRALGGIPVDRGLSTSTTKKIADIINNEESFFLLITPEGTRKRVERWKRGFYFIAQKAEVPIIMGFLDYKTKTGGWGPVLYPSGDYEADLKIIEDFYRQKKAKFPELFSLSPPEFLEPTQKHSRK